MWEYNQAPRSDELYHYGVLGMKWGHRKAIYKTIAKGAKQGKKSFEISDELSNDANFKKVASSLTDYKKARDDFRSLSEQRDKLYEANSKTISKKQIDKMVSDDIQRNKDFYKSWKSRFFDSNGKPTEELRSYVKDALETERALKNKTIKDADAKYNAAWKRYEQERKKAVRSLVGRYANRNIKEFSHAPDSSVRGVIEGALYDLDRKYDSR